MRSESSVLLDLNVVRPGDIIFSTSSGKLSRAIRLLTFSRYSHVMIYVGNSIIHADGGGVFSLNPQRKIVLAGHMVVYRLKGGLTPDQAIKITNFARSKVGCLYSVPEAIKAWTRWWRLLRATKDEQFCSRLVAQAYADVGIQIARNPDYCSPGRIARSAKLELVVGGVRRATEDDFRVAATKDTLSLHQESTFQWLSDVRKLAEIESIDVSSVNSAFDFIEKFPHYDNLAAEAILKSGYLTDYLMDEEVNPHRYDVGLFVSKGGVGSYAVRRELSINIDVANSALSGIVKYLPRRDLLIYKQEVALHRARAQQILKRLRVLLQVCNRLNLVGEFNEVELIFLRLETELAADCPSDRWRI